MTVNLSLKINNEQGELQISSYINQTRRATDKKSYSNDSSYVLIET